MSYRDSTPAEMLTDYAELLRWLASKREHNDKGCGGAAGCIKCGMLKKADRADELADEVDGAINPDGLEEAVRL